MGIRSFCSSLFLPACVLFMPRPSRSLLNESEFLTKRSFRVLSLVCRSPSAAFIPLWDPGDSVSRTHFGTWILLFCFHAALWRRSLRRMGLRFTGQTYPCWALRAVRSYLFPSSGYTQGKGWGRCLLFSDAPIYPASFIAPQINLGVRWVRNRVLSQSPNNIWAFWFLFSNSSTPGQLF